MPCVLDALPESSVFVWLALTILIIKCLLGDPFAIVFCFYNAFGDFIRRSCEIKEGLKCPWSLATKRIPSNMTRISASF